MTQIKICGLRRLEDARIVNEGRPEFIGFILTPSKRRVSVSEAAAISEALLPSIRRVGVFAGESPTEIAKIASQLSLDGIQLHLDTTSAFADVLAYELGLSLSPRMPFVWQRLPVSIHARSASEIALATENFADLSRFDGVLLDTRKKDQDGGSGQPFPWAPARDYLQANDIASSRVIIAGGLDAENVADAISYFQPYVVDVSSGVESDGYKDPKKVMQFIETVRKAQVSE